MLLGKVVCEQNCRPSYRVRAPLNRRAIPCNPISSQLPPVSTMSTNSLQSEGRDGAHSSLTASIGALNIAEQNSSLKPAKTAFGTVGVLLATIRVRPSLCNDRLPVHVYLGLGSRRSRLRQTWTIMRQCMSSSRPGVE